MGLWSASLPRRQVLPNRLPASAALNGVFHSVRCQLSTGIRQRTDGKAASPKQNSGFFLVSGVGNVKRATAAGEEQCVPPWSPGIPDSGVTVITWLALPIGLCSRAALQIISPARVLTFPARTATSVAAFRSRSGSRRSCRHRAAPHGNDYIGRIGIAFGFCATHRCRRASRRRSRKLAGRRTKAFRRRAHAFASTQIAAQLYAADWRDVPNLVPATQSIVPIIETRNGAIHPLKLMSVTSALIYSVSGTFI